MGFLSDIMGGSNQTQRDEATGSQQFAQAMQQEAQTQFPEEQAYQNTLGASGKALMANGANGFGYSTGENANLVSNIENAGATATTNTENASLLREQQASGGAQTMPTGAQEALNAQVAETGAQSTAAQLGQEREAGYQAGFEKYKTGAAEVGQAAELANPTGYAGAATSAEGQAVTAENAVQQANANSLTSKLIGAGIQAGTSWLSKPGASAPTPGG